ncbi:MAG: diaminopimelate epimerase [Bacteroidota bacterium]
MTIQFYKYQGTGNDFVIIDNRSAAIQLSTNQINLICDRRFGIGADGLMLLNTLDGYDFEMKYYNADGNESSMCGNGGRCLTRFAYDMGIHRTAYHFLAIDGEHDAEMDEHEWIRLKMKDVDEVNDYHGDTLLNTGSPHYIKSVQNIMELDVFHEGRNIRNSKDFITEGINVNFVEPENKHIIVRTYERGVENETYSCGTGVTAAAIVFAHNEKGFNRVEVKTKGGNLAVEFEKINDHEFRNIWLCGPAEFVYKGEITI